MNNPEKIEQPVGLTKNEAKAKISEILQNTAIMGANDYEPSAINDISTKLETGEITPEKAISMAQKILDSKQDYR